MAWIELLPSMHAEKDLRFADLSHHSIDQIRRLATLALDDQKQANQFAMQVYAKRLEPGE